VVTALAVTARPDPVAAVLDPWGGAVGDDVD
jgi:hypothetical protein